MANLTASRVLPYKIPGGKSTLHFRALRLAGYTNFGGGTTEFTLFKHSITMCDVSDTDGYFRDIDSGVTITNTDIFGGISMEKQKVTELDTADGSVKASIFVDGIWGFAKGSIAITDIGAVAYATDDTTITTGTSGGLAIGLIVDVDDTYVWVDIADYAGKVSSTTT